MRVRVLRDLKENIPVSEDGKLKLMPYKDALVKLAEANVPLKAKMLSLCKRVEDLYKKVDPCLGFLML